MLHVFVREARASLRNLTCLALYQDITGGSADAAAVLSNAMRMLVSACPALNSLTLDGHLSSTFVRSLGESCPLLNALTFVTPRPQNREYAKEVLKLQPFFLPHITSLTLHGCDDNYKLPNLIGNTSIVCLDVGDFGFRSEAEWLLLPPRLQHLKCLCIAKGPPTLPNDRALLSSLLSLHTLKDASSIMLHCLAQLLRAAPALQSLTLEPGQRQNVHMNFTSGAATAADLTLVLRRTELSSIREAWFHVDGNDRGEEPLVQTALLPQMTGITRCMMWSLIPGELGSLLRLLPDVCEINLRNCSNFTDVELQQLAVCAQLTTLRLARCEDLTPMGLFAICLRLPQLRHVVCAHCPQLERRRLEGCGQLLQQHGLVARLACVSDWWPHV